LKKPKDRKLRVLEVAATTAARERLIFSRKQDKDFHEKKREKAEKNGRKTRYRNASSASIGFTLSSIMLVLCVPNTKKGFSTKTLICPVYFSRELNRVPLFSLLERLRSGR